MFLGGDLAVLAADEAEDLHGVFLVPGILDELRHAIAVDVVEESGFVVGRARVDELVNLPESLAVVAGSRVFKPIHILQRERAGEDIEITIPVHVVKVLGIVLHVVGPERQDLAQRPLLEIRSLIPEFTRSHIGLAIAINVTDSDTFVVVLVQLLHAPFQLRSQLALSLGCSIGSEREGEQGQNKRSMFHVAE